MDRPAPRLSVCLFWMLAGCTVGYGTCLAEAIPLPSCRYGSVTVAGAPAASGTEVSAQLPGRVLSSTRCLSLAGGCVYLLDVPGDRPETPEVEGAAPGESFELRIGNALAASSIWTSGAHQALDLGAAAGPDLQVEIGNGVAVLGAGGRGTYLATVTNAGPGTARGIALVGELPIGATGASASDGGAFTGGEVRWPLFDLPAGGTASRTFAIDLAPSFPAGVERMVVRAVAEHDGSTGTDPVPANGSAVDDDALEASPDLVTTVDDGRAQVSPGDLLIFRIRVTNRGSQGATGVVLTSRLPPSVNLFWASHGGEIGDEEVVWAPIALDAGSSIERSVTLELWDSVSASVQQISSEVRSSDDGANGSDLNPGDNLAVDSDAVHHLPDLVAWALDRSGVAVNVQTLAVSGAVEIRVSNFGSVPASPFQVVAFEDRDLDGIPSVPADLILGAVEVPGLDTFGGISLTIPVAGELLFANDRIFVKADFGDEIVERDERNNQRDSGADCAAPPAVVAFAPILERSWPAAGAPVFAPGSIDSLSTPIVVQLTDDNGDGRRDERDVPDLVFVTSDLYNLLEPQIYLRAIRGDSGAEIFHVGGFLPGPISSAAFSFSGLAAGDLDNDGAVELVTTTFGPTPADSTLVALEHDGTWKWRSSPYRTHPQPGGLSNRDNPTLADLNGDGSVEILVGANVFDRRGHLLWRGSGGQAFQSAGNASDRGGAISVAADLDLDGRLEVVTGNTAYRFDGSIVWQVPLADGYPAVGQFDGDPAPEIAVVSRGTVRLHDDDGELLWGPVDLPGTDPEAGGAPTVADYDGDGSPEIAVAGSDVFVVFDTDGSILWQAATRDYTSNLTGSTAFDFDGDGSFEAVYRDERKLRVFRGTNGSLLFEDTLSSNTWTEEPVVADVDRDGHAEIVVASDRAPDVPIPAGGRTAGIRVYGDGRNGWRWARPIWNQHAYSVDNVKEDGGVPARPDWGWLSHNSFRANRSFPEAPLAGPDLSASRLVVDFSAPPSLRLAVRVGNGGRTPVGPGLKVAFYDGAPPAAALLGVREVPSRLEPGAFADVDLLLASPGSFSGEVTAVADDNGLGTGREPECDETNNAVTASYDPAALGLWLTNDDGVATASAGDELSYTIAVHNEFAAPASGMVLRDQLPSRTRFVAASDGGTESGGLVAWPVFVLASGASTVRTLTVRVDSDLPATVTALANWAEITHDGTAGVDPTPENNTAIDVDAVPSVTARAGGPYATLEGSAVLLDGSGSSDRDGTIVAYDWDLDGDGEFDDAQAPSTPFVPADEGNLPIALRVRDDQGEIDVDRTTLTVQNVAPTLALPPGLAGREGAPLSLLGVNVTDPGAVDLLVAEIDWGDGSTSAGVPILGGGIPATRTYPDDGSYRVGLCVRDGDGGSSCAEVPVAIGNEPPVIDSVERWEVLGWVPEELGDGVTAQWSVAGNGSSAAELRNAQPAVLVGDLPAFGVHELVLRVDDELDDDFIGVALGFAHGDFANPSASYLLLDWKRGDQDGARRGLAVSRVTGRPTSTELWLHADLSANGVAEGVVELARGATRGASGWAPHTEYRLRVDFGPTWLRVWVDGTLEVDLAGSFGGGELALYDYSQPRATFVAVAADLAVTGVEGEVALLRARFADAGVLDRHSAAVTWGDGLASSLAITEEGGRGETAGSHVYADDGRFGARLCVRDEDGGEGCREIPAYVTNEAPALSLVVAQTGYLGDTVSLLGTAFSDPGVLDLHSATVSWGDGSNEAGTVQEASGQGTVAASHTYAAPGQYTVRVCVDDGDGGIACDTRGVPVVARSLDLSLTQTLSSVVARPGQRVTFGLGLRNAGTLPATGVVVTDPVPPHLTFVSASPGGTYSGGQVTWSLPSLIAGSAASLSFEADVAAAAPFGASVTNTATVTDDGVSGPDLHPEDNVARAVLRFTDGVSPIVQFSQPLAGIEGQALALSGVTWSDTTAGESHTVTVEWGDGASGPLSGSFVGTGGTITGSHVYADNGDYAIRICVRDAAAHADCGDGTAHVENSAPVVVEPGSVDLRSWQVEEYATPDPPARWTVAADGLRVVQSINSQPSVFHSPLPALETTLQGVLRVGPQGEWDDDFIGFVLGFRTGDSVNPAADFLLLDWRQAAQGGAPKGLALSRVHGVPTGNELWVHASNDPANGLAQWVEPLARAATLGATGWIEFRDYVFRFEYTETRLRIWVDGVLQFDVVGAFPSGRFGFYNNSQQDVTYRGYVSGMAQQLEGETFALVAPFTDPGVVDTFTASVDWGDGGISTPPTVASGGYGHVDASHAYLDDGSLRIEACVGDDDGATDCGQFPLLVLNVPPVVAAAPDATVGVGETVDLPLASFTDAGRLDTHVATISWGDGTTGGERVSDDGGAGSVEGAHRFAAPGSYPVSVCVGDDDGGQACTALTVHVQPNPPALSATKTVTAVDRDGDGQVSPGDELVYRVDLANLSATRLTEVTLTDPIPLHTRIVPGSVVPALSVLSESPVVVSLAGLAPAEAVTVRFAVAIDSPLPAGVREIVNSGVVTSAETPEVLTDDPALPGTADPTRVRVIATPALALVKRVSLEDLDGNGVATAGDELAWTIEILANGDTPASGLVLTDAVPAHTALVAGSLTTTAGEVVSVGPIVVSLDALAVGSSAVVAFRTRIDADLAPEVLEVVNQASAIANEIDGQPSDDPLTPEPADPTRMPVYVLPELTLSSVEVQEGNAGLTPMAFELALDRPARLPVSVTWVAEGLTASPGEDFLPASGIATFAVGSRVTTVPIAIVGDGVVEGDEALRLRIVSAQNAIVVAGEWIGTIRDDDEAFLSVADLSIAEGGTAQFAITLSAPSVFPISVDWATADGTALAGSDYLAASGTLIFPPLTTVLAVAVATVEDEVPELVEGFRLALADSSGAGLADAAAEASIEDDDPTDLSVSDVTLDEGDVGPVEIHVPVQLSRAHTAAVRVDYSTEDGSALAGEDYLPTSGTLEFAPGVTVLAIPVTVAGDTTPEPDETFGVRLSASVHAGIADPIAEVSLRDDDAPSCALTCPADFAVAAEEGRCEARVTYLPPATAGECGVVTCSPPSGATFVVGTTTVNCLAASAAVSCAFAIVVEDREPPAVAAPQLVVPSSPGACSAVVPFVPSATDNCPGVGAVLCEPPPGAELPVGVTDVTCTATDARGLTGSAVGTIQVDDVEAPRITSCPPDVSLQVPAGDPWPVVEFPSPGAEDNCPGVAVDCRPPTGSSFPFGSTAVTCTAIDAAALTDTCGLLVSVEPLSVLEIPALSGLALAGLATILGLCGVAVLRRRTIPSDRGCR